MTPRMPSFSVPSTLIRRIDAFPSNSLGCRAHAVSGSASRLPAARRAASKRRQSIEWTWESHGEARLIVPMIVSGSNGHEHPSRTAAMSDPPSLVSMARIDV